MLLLDASKAFDCVEYVKLFSDLRERKLCPIVLRLLVNIYIYFLYEEFVFRKKSYKKVQC